MLNWGNFHNRQHYRIFTKKYLNECIIFLEGIKAIGKLEEIDEDLFLSIEIQNEEKFKLKIATLYDDDEYELDFSWDNWLNSTDPLKIKERKKREEEEERKEIQKREKEKRKVKEKKKEKIRNLVIYSVMCIVSFIITIVAIFLETNDKDSMLGIPLGMLGVIGLITSLSMLNDTY